MPSSLTPLTDEFVSLGVLSSETIQQLRTQELQGTLDIQEARSTLEQCRTLALTNAELEGQNLDHTLEMISSLKESQEQEKHTLFARIESAENTTSQEESDTLLQNL